MYGQTPFRTQVLISQKTRVLNIFHELEDEIMGFLATQRSLRGMRRFRVKTLARQVDCIRKIAYESASRHGQSE